MNAPLIISSVALALAATSAGAQTVQSHIAAGDAARCKASPAEAAAHFRAALQMDSTSYEANWKAARALVDVGKVATKDDERDAAYAEAKQFAERAVRLNQAGADGHYVTAIVTGRQALTMGARDRVKFAGVVREEALRALDLDARHDGALHVMGRWNAEIERLPAMARVIARTFLGASVFSNASWDNAVKYFDDAVKVDPRNIYHHLDLAEALIDAGRKDEARAHLDQVMSLPLGCDPEDANYKKAAAKLLERVK